jgi:phage terminase large subunit GpA-like protein
MPSGKEIVAAAWADAIRPDREISIVDWIESNVVLEEAETSSPGQYRFRRAPYMREILETLSPDCPCQYVTTMKGSQLGMTIGAGAYICFLIAESPCTIIMVSPTLDLAKRASRRKVGPLIVKTDAVRERVRDFGARRAGNTALMKEFPGGVLLFAGGNSGAGLRQLSARVLILDELDVFPAFVPNEGDPEILAERAVKTFSRRKVFKISTPTITGRSRIAQNYEQSDRSRFFVPCPFCGEFQVLWFTDPKTGRKCLRWEGDAPNLTVWYECVKCEARIVEGKKPWMLENGIWRAEHPELSNYHRGFAISSLYAAAGTFSWLKIANQFLEAGKDQMKLCAFVNQVLGETWEEHGDSPPWEELYRRREDYPIGEVPRRGLVLTAGADVQRDRIEVEIVAWGRGRESWSIDYVVIPGDTAMPAPWSKLAELLDRLWKHADGRDLRITGLGVDSSYDGNSVYNWCRRWPADRVFAMRGESHLSTLVGAPSYVDYTWRGKKAYRAVRLWHIGVDVAKRELYGWLRIPAPLNPDTEAYDAGFCHFPKYRERHFEGLTAEHLSAVAKKGGRVGYVWNVHFARNEPLDCRVYARAAAAIVGVDRYSDDDWKRLELELQSGLKKSEAVEVREVRQSPTRRPKRGGFFQRWPSRKPS